MGVRRVHRKQKESISDWRKRLVNEETEGGTPMREALEAMYQQTGLREDTEKSLKQERGRR